LTTFCSFCAVKLIIVHLQPLGTDAGRNWSECNAAAASAEHMPVGCRGKCHWVALMTSAYMFAPCVAYRICIVSYSYLCTWIWIYFEYIQIYSRHTLHRKKVLNCAETWSGCMWEVWVNLQLASSSLQRQNITLSRRSASSNLHITPLWWHRMVQCSGACRSEPV
jgi:hypothetical protein